MALFAWSVLSEMRETLAMLRRLRMSPAA
jgi:hypothetical protein